MIKYSLKQNKVCYLTQYLKEVTLMEFEIKDIRSIKIFFELCLSP